jgi:hypothetical protein
MQMKRYLSIVGNFLILVIVLSCEEKVNINKSVVSSFQQLSGARKSVDPDFRAYDFEKYGIKPLWDQADELMGKIIEVPFEYKNKVAFPRLKEYENSRGRAKLLLYKVKQKVIAQVVYFFPSATFKENLDKVTINSYKTHKFSGILIFQELGESDLHVRYISEGKITEKKLGKKVVANGRIASCQLWGMFLDTYDEYGNITSSDLLYTFDVCTDDPTQEQPGPDPSGGSPDPLPGPVNSQLLFDTQAYFSWLNGHPEVGWLFGDLAACNINGLFSNAFGPANNPSSYSTPASAVQSTCIYGTWTPTVGMIGNITPQCSGSPCNLYMVETTHSGNINVDIEGVVSAAASVGFTVKIAMSHTGTLHWFRVTP